MNKGEEGKLLQGIYRLSDSLVSLSEKIEKKSGHVPELIVITLYVIGHVLMSLVHEPWFDEALAWLISRDSSIYDIMFEATHYEGHPALWHLVLAPFAKSGAPYELSLSFVSLLFSGTAVALFVWKAPFKRIFRITIPFTYFIFYQYSVVSRPYCMMMLAFVLMAITYKSRNEHPGRFVCSMLFLCATSAYGIVIAGGVTIAWLIEMFIGDTGEFGQEGENGRNWTAGQNCEDRYSLNDRTTMHDEAGCDIDEKRYNSDKRYNSEDIKNIENRQSKRESNSRFHSFMQKLLQNGKIIWLGILLAYALFVIWRILPADDAYAVVNSAEAENPLIVRGLYTFFAAFSDLFFSNAFCASRTLQLTDMYYWELGVAVILGAMVIIIIFLYARTKGKVLLFVIPYFMFSSFSAFVYLYRHHIGIYLLFIIFFFWCCNEKKSDMKNEANKPVRTKVNINVVLCNKGVRTIKTLGVSVCIVIPVVWSLLSVANDIAFEYSCGKNEYDFISKYGLQDSKILCEYVSMKNQNEEMIPLLSFSMYEVCLAPYNEKMKLINHMSDASLSYALIHKIISKEVNDIIIYDAAEYGYPDIIIGNPDLLSIYGDGVKISDYDKKYETRGGVVWKGVPDSSNICIYTKKVLNR